MLSVAKHLVPRWKNSLAGTLVMLSVAKHLGAPHAKVFILGSPHDFPAYYLCQGVGVGEGVGNGATPVTKYCWSNHPSPAIGTFEPHTNGGFV